jgi:hypothetical protein
MARTIGFGNIKYMQSPHYPWTAVAHPDGPWAFAGGGGHGIIIVQKRVNEVHPLSENYNADFFETGRLPLCNPPVLFYNRGCEWVAHMKDATDEEILARYQDATKLTAAERTALLKFIRINIKQSA